MTFYYGAVCVKHSLSTRSHVGYVGYTAESWVVRKGNYNSLIQVEPDVFWYHRAGSGHYGLRSGGRARRRVSAIVLIRVLGLLTDLNWRAYLNLRPATQLRLTRRRWCGCGAGNQ